MPTLPLIPLLTLLVGAAGTGTSIYEGIKSNEQASDARKAQQQALLQQQQSQAKQADLTKREAVLGAQGQAQQQTGGSLTDPGTTSFTDLLAGYPGYQGGGVSGGATPAIATTGIPGAPSSGGGATPNIADILATLRNGGESGSEGSGAGNISGGNWQVQPSTPQQWQELANPPLG